MNLKLKKIILIFLALFTAIAVGAGCNKENTPENGGQTKTEAEDDRAAPDNNGEFKYIADYLPDVKYNGYEFRVLSTPNTAYDGLHTAFDVEEETGSNVEDAIYKRNRIIEEKYDIKIKQIEATGWDDCVAKFKKSTSAASDDFDLCMLISREAWAAAIDGRIVTVDKLPYLDVSRPWYAQYVNSEISVEGKLLFAYSDECLNMFEQTLCVFFNKKIVEDLALENIYNLVKGNKWTIDKFFEFSKTALADLDGDDVWTDSDRYGIVTQSDMFYPCFWVSSGIKTVAKDSGNLLVFTGNTEKLFGLLGKVHENVFGGPKIVYDANVDKFTTIKGGGAEPGRDSSTQQFANNLALFYVRNIAIAESMRSVETDFGIVPFPKYDEAQDKYYSRIIDGWINVVPVTNSDLEKTSVIMEAAAVESKNVIVPAYFEVSLRYKYTRDDESQEMLDIIHANMTMDVGDTFYMDAVRNIYMGAMKSGDFVSAVEKKIGSVEKTLQKANDMIQSLD
ncbi:MAG: hypothetical protein FWD23_08485 [Oscillospiraceae bacterium]|nr:hypothetical protein [Oscillospiraceae bacterium]